MEVYVLRNDSNMYYSHGRYVTVKELYNATLFKNKAKALKHITETLNYLNDSIIKAPQYADLYKEHLKIWENMEVVAYKLLEVKEVLVDTE